ncbi:MAG: glycerophosphodiester phosphodiesterase [Actinobacteria bacterium]|nr:glycerophosphodiester phosphodiesterase [Actinomycetota bacterium]
MGVSDVVVRPQVIAHRGASRAERENTVEAFRRAGVMRSDAVELDVRRTSDGVLVVHHNPDLADGRLVAATQHADLPAHVPTFEAALDACAGMWVNVEIKNDPAEADFDPTDAIADRTMEVLMARGESERWLISSFRLETVDRCRAIADSAPTPGPRHIRTAWLTTVVPDEAVDAVVERLVAGGHSALHPWVETLGRRVVDACHAHGLQVNTWTCDDPDRMRELAGWGIDGICTNVPDIALGVLSDT